MFVSVFRIQVSVQHTASPTTGRLLAIIRRPVASAILFWWGFLDKRRGAENAENRRADLAWKRGENTFLRDSLRSLRLCVKVVCPAHALA